MSLSDKIRQEAEAVDQAIGRYIVGHVPPPDQVIPTSSIINIQRFFDNHAITVTDETASRAIDATTYHNTSGFALLCNVTIYLTTQPIGTPPYYNIPAFSASIIGTNGIMPNIQIAQGKMNFNMSASTFTYIFRETQSVTFIVPKDWYYYITANDCTLYNWNETILPLPA